MDKLPKNWNVIDFGSLVVNLDGKRIPLKSGDREKRQGEIPYYGASGIIDYIDDFIFEGEHLLISEDGANLLARTYPIAFIATGKFWVNNHAHIVNAKPEITTNQFLVYYFSSKNISEYVTGSAQPKLNQKNLNKIPIPVPPLSEQNRIVSKLDSLFERIDKSIALLEENIKQTEHLMASALDEVFREIQNFESQSFDEIKETNVIGLVKSVKQQSTEFQYPYFKMNNISNSGKLFLNDVVNVEATEKEVEKYSLRKDDFLFNTRNSKELVGKTCIYNCDEHMLFNNNIMRVRFKENINPYFIDYQFKSNGFKNKLENIKSGTTNVSAIYYKSLKDLELLIPKQEIQERIVKYLTALENKTDILIREQNIKLTNLKSLKESILDKAFKGEL